MFFSDRCMFCREFYEKEKPFICLDCWKAIKEVVAEYPQEFQPPNAELSDGTPKI